MHAKKKPAPGVAATAGVPKEAFGKSAGTNAYPALLNGQKIRPFVLPADFDTTVHQKLHMSGKAKAATVSELQDMIEVLAKRKPRLG